MGFAMQLMSSIFIRVNFCGGPPQQTFGPRGSANGMDLQAVADSQWKVAAHVTRATLRDPCHCCLRQKSRPSASSERHLESTPTNGPVQFHPHLPRLPACLILLHCLLKVFLYFPTSFYPPIPSFRSPTEPEPPHQRSVNSLPSSRPRLPHANSKLAPPRLLLARFPRRAIVGFLSSRVAASRVCCYHNRGVHDGVGLEPKNYNSNERESNEERVAEMAPKQATLGYVKSGQMTLGWVVSAAEI